MARVEGREDGDVNSKQNIAALNFVKGMIKSGSMKLTNQIGAGWGGEGFGKQLCAMTIEGNWITGAMTHDYPSVAYKVVELPAGRPERHAPVRRRVGLAAASKNKADATTLISYLTATKVTMGNAKAFGVMPPVLGAAKDGKKLYPQLAPFLAGAEHSKSIPTIPDIAKVLGDFNQQLQALPNTNAKTILDRVQAEMQAILKKEAPRRGFAPAGGPAPPAGYGSTSTTTKGGRSAEAIRAKPLDSAAGARDPRPPGGSGLAVPRAGDRHPRVVPDPADRDGRLGQLLGLERQRKPVRGERDFVGLENYRHVLTTPGLDQSNFGTSLRNNFYYVVLVVPIQTAVSLFLAVLVNRRVKVVGFFRTAFYFPSVTSSVAITVLFLFLFSPAGAINKLLSYFGARPGLDLRPARPLPRHPRTVRRP